MASRHPAPLTRAVERLLVVEDHAILRAAMVRRLRRWQAEVVEASTHGEAMAGLANTPDLVVCDVRLPGGSAESVALAAMRLQPAPVIVAISGEASAEEAFALAQLGVRGYLAKPFALDALEAELRAALSHNPPLRPLLAATVGHRSLREVQGEVRRTMVEQAMALTRGSRRGAARLLDVSRQAVQQMLRTRDRGDGHSAPH